MGPVEMALKIFPFNETLQQELAKLEAEGWQVVPGLAPAVSYVLFRPALQPQPVAEPVAAGFGQLGIDETKVHIYRNGKLVEAGENSNG